MRSIITAAILVLLSNSANAQEVQNIYNCIAGAAAPTPVYVSCPSDLRPMIGEATLSGRANTILINKANAEIARLRRNAKGNESRIAALEAAVLALQARANCVVPGDPAVTKQCFDAQADSARALRGEAVALKAIEKGAVRLEVMQGAGNGQPGYVFEMEAPPVESPLHAAAFDARLRLSADESLQPIEHLGALGALGFTLGGGLIGAGIGYGIGDDDKFLDDGRRVKKGDEAKTAFIGAGIGAGAGLALYGITEGIIAMTNSSRAETRRRLVVTPGGVAGTF